jgi:NADH-quinone oxidoreductase subunit N
LAGFFGKFYLFSDAIGRSGNLAGLTVLALAMNAVSLYYYLMVLKAAFVEAPREGLRGEGEGGSGAMGVIVICAVLVVVFGLMPDWLVGALVR